MLFGVRNHLHKQFRVASHEVKDFGPSGVLVLLRISHRILNLLVLVIIELLQVSHQLVIVNIFAPLDRLLSRQLLDLSHNKVHSTHINETLNQAEPFGKQKVDVDIVKNFLLV